MLKVKTGLRMGELLIVGFLVIGLAGPALAGNVWSWVTDDGTYAFTDDPKRIPARHRGEARTRPMGELTRYERYTEVSTDSDEPYAERLRARQTELRAEAGTAPLGAVIGAPPTQGAGVVYAIPATGGRGSAGSGASIMLPLRKGQTPSDPEPTTVESIRVRSRESLATRHFTVVKQGDRIVTVIKGERRQRSLEDAPFESELDL